MFKKPLIIFLSASLFLCAIFFFLPINIFDGEVIHKVGLSEYTESRRIGLYDFIWIGKDELGMIDVERFYLTGKGITMALLFILGFPALLAYRIYLKDKKKWSN